MHTLLAVYTGKVTPKILHLKHQKILAHSHIHTHFFIAWLSRLLAHRWRKAPFTTNTIGNRFTNDGISFIADKKSKLAILNDVHLSIGGMIQAWAICCCKISIQLIINTCINTHTHTHIHTFHKTISGNQVRAHSWPQAGHASVL